MIPAQHLLLHRANRHGVVAGASREALASAAGGLTGALLHSRASTPALSIIFGSLLIFVAISELSGLAKRMQLHGSGALLGGAAKRTTLGRRDRNDNWSL